jgi:hypothetical protein
MRVRRGADLTTPLALSLSEAKLNRRFNGCTFF